MTKKSSLNQTKISSMDLLLFALLIIGYVIKSIMAGKINCRGLYYKTKNPFLFWLSVIVYLACAMTLLYCAAFIK